MEHNLGCYLNLSPRCNSFAHINAFYSSLQSKINFGLLTGAATKGNTIEAQKNHLLYSNVLEMGGTAHTGSLGKDARVVRSLGEYLGMAFIGVSEGKARESKASRLGLASLNKCGWPSIAW